MQVIIEGASEYVFAQKEGWLQVLKRGGCAALSASPSGLERYGGLPDR
jgi:hypothetical protein